MTQTEWMEQAAQRIAEKCNVSIEVARGGVRLGMAAMADMVGVDRATTDAYLAEHGLR